MALDWIRMRLDLDEDPAVMHMAERMGINEVCIVGYCWKIWVWVSRQCNADCVTGVTLLSLGRVTGTGNFPLLMAEVGWLHEVEIDGIKSIKIEKFDRWLSEGSKQRALTAERVRRHRDKKCNADSVTKGVTFLLPREEKRREEKSIKKKPPAEVKKKAAVAARVCPTLGEVREFFESKGTAVSPEEFHAYYTANGWRQANGNLIKDWQACLTTWEAREKRESKNGSYKIPEDF